MCEFANRAVGTCPWNRRAGSTLPTAEQLHSCCQPVAAIMPSTKMSTTSEREMREVHRHERSVLAHLWTGQSALAGSHAPSLIRSVPLAPAGLFNMAFVMAKEVNISSAAVVASKLVDFVQMLAFPLNAKPVFPWSTNGDGTVLAIVSRSLDYVTTDTVDEVCTGGGAACQYPRRDRPLTDVRVRCTRRQRT